MNAQLREGELLAPTGTAIAEFNATEAGLALLREELAGATFDCTTTEGDKQARDSRRALVGLRTELEAKRKALKAPLLERGKLLDDEAKRITGEIVKLETPIDDAIRAEERRKEAARQERERIAAEKAAAVTAQIDRIRSMPITYVAASADVLRQTIAEVESMKPAEVFEGADVQRAEDARQAALAGLQRALDGRIEADAERERLAAERAELERQRAEQADAQRAEQARLDAERAELERQRLDAERREAEAKALRDLEEADRAAEAAEAQRVEEQRQIASATLRSAAEDAMDLLTNLGHGEHIVTRKLAAALAKGRK